jgi:ACS family hexuronate transporter-like MFS transporter
MSTSVAQRPAVSRVRWTICGLLFFATTINYVDRQVLSLLAKTLETQVGWTDLQYSNITTAFTVAYAIGLLGAGRLLDRYGTRIGFAVAIAVWSVAAMGHAVATSAFTFGMARAFLGLGEAANFPACIKTVAQWFPKKERAQATGIFNAGANIGAIVAPLAVPWLALNWGWQSAFIITGALGFVWLLFWLMMYRSPEEHSSVSPRELGYIQSDPPDKVANYPWMRLFPHRETWAFGVGKFLTDGVWWFYLFWLPKYLQDTFHLSLSQIIVPMIVVYNASSLGSIAGGWLSSTLIKRNWSVNASRKIAMLCCALAVVPVIYAPFCTSMWLVVALVSIATAAHQGWSANLFTMVSDTFPRTAVASVVGIGGTAGALGGALVQKFTGYVLTWTNSYFLMFVLAGTAYLLALALIQMLTPKLEPARLD